MSRYLDNVVAAERKMIAKVFHIFKWTRRELDCTIAALLEKGGVQEREIEGVKEPQLVSAQTLERGP